MSMLGRSAAGALGAIMLLGTAHGAEITGAGSTFVFPVLAKWSADYTAQTGTRILYQAIGSSGGINQIRAATVDFGVTDAPIKPTELVKLGLGQFPIVIGGVVPVVHIDGVQAGQMRFTGPLLADIYLGKVKTWNDPAVARLNPDLNLPDSPISVVHRSDGSGTTFNWVNYLSKASAEWRDKIGEGTAVDWPVGMGGKGNEGVAAFVAQTKNSIGYVEYAYVLQNKLAYALIQNKSGKFIKPDAVSFQAAAAGADWANAQDFFLVMTDAPGSDAYPVAASAFVLIYKKPKEPSRARLALDFFRSALERGQKQATDLDYVPLPPSLVQQIESYWKSELAVSH